MQADVRDAPWTSAGRRRPSQDRYAVSANRDASFTAWHRFCTDAISGFHRGTVVDLISLALALAGFAAVLAAVELLDRV